MATSDKARWYIIHTYSGSENKISETIKENAEKKGLSDYIGDILIPTEEVCEIKNGEKTNVTKKYFPGYILIKMILNEETWHLVRSTPRVTGFLGSKNKPSPINEKEVQRIVSQIEKSAEKPRMSAVYEVGDQVRIVDGAFSSFSGFVDEVSEDKQKLKVSVVIFGRATPVELDYTQVEKM